MKTYVWESERDILFVLGRLTDLTDKPEPSMYAYLFGRKTFTYRYIGNESYHFSLYLTLGRWPRMIHQPPRYRGIIKAMTSGCRIEAQPLKKLTIINAFLVLSFITIFYLGAIIAPITDSGRDSIVFSIVLGILATGMLCSFLFSCRKWLSNNELLNIIDLATDTRHQQFD